MSNNHHEKRRKSLKQRLTLAIIASFTLGLAPFLPEPHLFGKWRWLLGGAKGMKAMDWFDLLLHTAPWAFLIIVAIQWVKIEKKSV
jgi:hypothetical protein